MVLYYYNDVFFCYFLSVVVSVFLDTKSFTTSAMFSFNISYCSLVIFPLINSCFRILALFIKFLIEVSGLSEFCSLRIFFRYLLAVLFWKYSLLDLAIDGMKKLNTAPRNTAIYWEGISSKFIKRFLSLRLRFK